MTCFQSAWWAIALAVHFLNAGHNPANTTRILIVEEQHTKLGNYSEPEAIAATAKATHQVESWHVSHRDQITSNIVPGKYELKRKIPSQSALGNPPCSN